MKVQKAQKTPAQNSAAISEHLLERLHDLDRSSPWDFGLGIAIAICLLSMIVTAVRQVRNLNIEISAPAPLFFASLALLLMLAWLLHERTRKSYVTQFTVLLKDVQQEEQREQAVRDSLTGVYNRLAVEEFADRCLHQCERSGTSLALVVLDLDNFHELNRRQGHLAGDLALAQFARILQSSTRGSDMVARFGGDEFVLVLPDTNQAGVEVVLERLIERVEDRNRQHQDEGDVPLSFTSAASYARRGSTYRELFAQADQEMLRRKKPGATPARV